MMSQFVLVLVLLVAQSFAHDIPVKVFNVTEFDSGASIGSVFAGDGSDKSAEYYVVAIEPDSLESLYNYISIDMSTGLVYLKQISSSLKFSVLSISDGSAVTVVINFVESTTTTSTTTSTTTTTTMESTTTTETTRKPVTFNTCLNLNKYKLEQVKPSRLDARLIDDRDIDTYKCYLIESNSNATLNLNKYSRLGSMMEPIVAVDPDFFNTNRVVGLIVIDCSSKDVQDRDEDRLVYLNSQEELEDYYYSRFVTSKPDKSAHHHVTIDSHTNSLLTEQLLVKFECHTKRYAYNLRVKNNNYSYSNSNHIRSQLLILNQNDRKNSLVLCVVVKSLPIWTTTESDKAYFVTKSVQTDATTLQETTTTTTRVLSTTQVVQHSFSLSGWFSNQNNLVIVLITSSVALFIITAFICLLYLTMHIYSKWKEANTTTSYTSRRHRVGRKKPLNSALSTHTIETRASTNSSTSKCSTMDPKLKQSLPADHSNNPFCFSNSYLNELGGSCNLLDSMIINSNLNLVQDTAPAVGGAEDTSFGLANYRFDENAFVDSATNNLNYINSESSDLNKWSNLLDWKLEFNSLSNVLDDLARLK